MPNNHKLNDILEYVPAKVSEGKKDWIIVYYVKNPNFPPSAPLQRQRMKINKLIQGFKTLREKRNYASDIVTEINKKLKRGWNPYLEAESPRGMTPFKFACNEFLQRTKRRGKDKLLSDDTVRMYFSWSRNLDKYIESIGKENMYCTAFTKDFVIQFLDYLYFEREYAAVTRNNYLNFVSVLSTFFVSKGYSKENIADKIPSMKVAEKVRKIIPAQDRQLIKEYYLKNNIHFLGLCYCTFSCLIRPKELLYLKVGDINFEKREIYISASAGKNSKARSVAIPIGTFNFFLFLKLNECDPDLYLFSFDNFKPGKDPCTRGKIHYHWDKMREELNMPMEYQYYSLKDSGITFMLENQFTPIAVQNQARHSSINTTEKYFQSNLREGQEVFKNIDMEF